MNTNMIAHTAKHDDLRRQAKNAVAAYIHHLFFDATGAAPTGMTTAIIHGAAEYCLNSALNIANKEEG